MTIARLLASVALATMLAMPVPAQTIEDAAAAYQRGDLAGALTQYRRLAEQGLAEAQYSLGFMYETGEGVPEDDAEAVRWWRRADEQGHAGAQSDLGLMYAKGEGVPEDANMRTLGSALLQHKATRTPKRAKSSSRNS